MSLPPIADILEFLTSADPEMLELMGEAAVLEAFLSAAAEVPAYKARLSRHGVDPAAVVDIDAFRRLVPLTGKHNTFLAHPIHQLCRGGSLKGIKTIPDHPPRLPDPALRQALFSDGATHTPHFFVSYPMRSFIEEIPAAGWPGGDLAVSYTALDLPLPLFR